MYTRPDTVLKVYSLLVQDLNSKYTYSAIEEYTRPDTVLKVYSLLEYRT